MLEYGATYLVDVAPNFSYGAGVFGPQFTMCINTQVLMQEENQERNSLVVQNDDNLDSHIFPNPGSEMVNVVCDETIQKIRIFNSNGQLVELINPNQAGLITISTEKYTAGLYQLEITSRDKRSVQRVIISH